MFRLNLVHDYLAHSAARHPDKEALICGEERWTYGALERAARLLAAALSRIGVKRGDRVVVFLDNSSETVISLYAILKTGAIFVILDGSIKSGKLSAIVRDCTPAAVITSTAKADIIRTTLAEPGRQLPVVWVEGPQGTHQAAPGPAFSWAEIQRAGPDETDISGNSGAVCIDQDLAALIYTSGSTGDPKGVMASHLNMVTAARSVIQYLDNRPDDVIINVLPLSFGYGLYQVLMAFMFGGTVVLEKGFHYPSKILELIQRERATGFPLVPTIAALLLKMANFRKYDLTSLRYLTNAGAALPVEHIRRLRTLLPHVKLFSMYGLTECKRASYLTPEELDKRPASVGKAIPNTEVFIVNEAGEKASAGETGELVVRGSHVARGYWNSPELTSQVFRPGFVPGERLLYTGDLFTHDQEGFLYYVGRKHEQIKVKGERVSPREVENVLCQMDRVLEAAVFGAADEILGQAIVACIVCADGPRPTVQEVLRFCSSRLAPLMMPKFVIMFDAMPKSSNGKIDKNMLKVLFEESKHLRHSPAAEHSRQEKSVLPLPADSDRPGENRSPGNVPEGGMPDQTSTAPCPPSSQP